MYTIFYAEILFFRGPIFGSGVKVVGVLIELIKTLVHTFQTNYSDEVLEKKIFERVSL